jgi:outer membrane protein assembly factor BamB
MSKATPVLWKDEIIIHRAPEVVAFDLKTGARKWWVRASSQGTGTPVAGGDLIYVGTWLNDGEPDLRVPPPDFESLVKTYDRNGDTMLSAEELPEKIQISRRFEVEGIPGADMSVAPKDFFKMIDKNNDGRIEKSEWEVIVELMSKNTSEHGLLAIKPGGEGEVTKTRIVWKEPRAVPEIPTPLCYGDRVYTVTNGGIVSAMDAKTGKLEFRGRLGAGGPYFASPVAAGGRIYFASGEGTVSVIGGGERLEVLARNDLEEPIFATPAIAGGVIFVRTTGGLNAFAE